jgi:hypothetical protein
VQWQVSTDGGNTFTDLAGENASTLTPFQIDPPQYGGPNQNGWEYRAVFTNAGGQIISSAATLTVNVPQWMTTTDGSLVNLYNEYEAYLAGPQTQPFQFPSQNLIGGGGYVTVSVYTPYPYKPQALADVESALTSAGAQNMLPWQGFTVSASLPISQLPTIGALSDVSWVQAAIPPLQVAYPDPLPPISPIDIIAYPYPPVITPIVSPIATPIVAPIFVTAQLPPLILTNPISRTVTAGQDVILSAAASGNAKVQWQVSTNGGKTFKNLAGENESTLTLRASAEMNGFEYRAVFTNVSGHSTTSVAKLVVKVSRGSAR